MTSTTLDDFSLTKLAARHWRLALCVSFGCIGLAGLLTIVLPRKYESRMKFLVNNERADLVITPEKGPSTAPIGEVDEAQVNSEMELLRSRDILGAIVEDAKLYRPYQKDNRTAPTRLSTEHAVLRLEKDLNVSALRKTNIIEVTYKAGDPDRAAFVLRDLTDRYLTSHLLVHSTPGTYKFFTDEVANYRSQWEQTQTVLSNFHRQKHLFAMDQQQTAIVARLESVEAQLKDLHAEIEEQHSRLDQDNKQLAQTSERVTTQVKQVPNLQAIQQLETMLTELRNKRIALAMKFKPTDRLIVELDQEIQSTSQSLADIRSGSPSERTSDLDTLHESLKADAAREQVALSGLETRRAEMAAMRQAYLQQLSGMDTDSIQLRSLEQNEKEAEDNYLLYSRRLQESKLSNSLDREKFSNVVVIEKPVSSPIPVSPKLGLNLAVGAVMGIFLSLLLAFIKESNGGTPDVRTSSPGFYPERAFSAQASGD
jgi:succinoglycan biosynthesis transport protein ExoP